MKIINFKKKKLNTYELTLSNNESVLLYDDVILKYNLLITKEIDNKLLDVIKKENDKYYVYYESIKYITKRLRTEKEVRNKFKEYNKDVIDNVIERLKKEKYLNEQIYIKSYTNDVINLKSYGPLKIKRELINLGINSNLIDNYLNTISDYVWKDKIEKIITKKINSNHTVSAYVLKNKIINDLKNNGYSTSLINELINNFEFNDSEDIYNREYNKVKKRYEKKYSSDELEYKIKNYLYQKGFRK